MKRFYWGLFLGVLISSCAFHPLLKLEQESKYEFGRNQGYGMGALDVATQIGKEFGKDGTDVRHSWYLPIKDTALVAVEINGVRTIREVDYDQR
ncbi:MAG: hypothetical protein IPL32_06000 [Chloracidobacterium sp.]|nr:hypothetical protein [Chloracidobacterium sp.]